MDEVHLIGITIVRKIPCVTNPLSFLPCTQENFMSWQASFLTAQASDWRRSKPSLLHKCTGKEYFELNVDTKEVDWDLFKESDV